MLVVNQGKILADVPGMAISTLGQGFTNEGTLEASSGGHLNLTNLQVTSGTVNVRPDSTLSVAGTWSNTGTITSDGGTVNLGGTFTLSTLGTFQRTGGAVNLPRTAGQHRHDAGAERGDRFVAPAWWDGAWRDGGGNRRCATDCHQRERRAGRCDAHGRPAAGYERRE